MDLDGYGWLGFASLDWPACLASLALVAGFGAGFTNTFRGFHAGMTTFEVTEKEQLSLLISSKAEDEKTLAATLSECDARSREFENNQVVRSGEIKACEQAVGILRSDAVSGNADKHLPSALVQVPAPFSCMISSVDSRN